MNKIIKISLILILVALLVLVRAYESNLFYDPFIIYFKQDFLSEELPLYDLNLFLINHLYRFSINFLLSITIIYIAFENWQFVKFSIWVFTISFLVLIPLYYFMIYNNFSFGYIIAFYVRRFLIHPLLLIILIPALYFKKKYTFENLSI